MEIHYTIRIIKELKESYGAWPKELVIKETACGLSTKSMCGLTIGDSYINTTRRLSQVTCKSCRKTRVYKKHRNI
jgi:hypothetical protein